MHQMKKSVREILDGTVFAFITELYKENGLKTGCLSAYFGISGLTLHYFNANVKPDWPVKFR